MSQELITKINQLNSELKKVKQQLNKFNSMDANLIELFTDGNSACLKIYLNNKELSIAFKKIHVESQYGNCCFIPEQTKVFDLDSNDLSNESTNPESNPLHFYNIHIDNSEDLMRVLDKLKD